MNLEVPNCFSRSGIQRPDSAWTPNLYVQLLTASCVALPGNWRFVSLALLQFELQFLP